MAKNSDDNKVTPITIAEGMFAYHNPIGYIIMQLVFLPFKIVWMLLVTLLSGNEDEEKVQEPSKVEPPKTPQPKADTKPVQKVQVAPKQKTVFAGKPDTAEYKHILDLVSSDKYYAIELLRLPRVIQIMQRTGNIEIKETELPTLEQLLPVAIDASNTINDPYVGEEHLLLATLKALNHPSYDKVLEALKRYPELKNQELSNIVIIQTSGEVKDIIDRIKKSGGTKERLACRQQRDIRQQKLKPNCPMAKKTSQA